MIDDLSPTPLRTHPPRPRAPRGITAAILTATLGFLTSGCGQTPPATGASNIPQRTGGNTALRAPSSAALLPGMPPPLNPTDVYAADRPGALSPQVANDPARVYVPNTNTNTVDVIDQRTYRIVGHFAAGAQPQHVTPSYDLRTLWVDNDKGNTLTPVDPMTGRQGARVAVDDPYNLYFTPNGRRAIVVAEARQRLDFRDPRTMALRHPLKVACDGVDHMDFTADGRFLLASCEFAAKMIVVDVQREKVLQTIPLRPGGKPQDVKLAPDGRVFYVADMIRSGVYIIDARNYRVLRFVPTGRGAHGLYASRDSRSLYVTNRDEGSVSVISFATGRVERTWRLPGSASPDMGGVSIDGKVLWLTGRYNSEVYAIDTQSGRLRARIPVGSGPHGLSVFPQPGRYSLGHTGVMR